MQPITYYITTSKYLKIPIIISSLMKQLNFMVCKLYLNKFIKKQDMRNKVKQS